MPTYTPIFGGSPLNPSQVSYTALTLTANTTLAWPLEGAPAATPLASTIDVTSTVSSYSLTLPDATGGGNGYGILINNLSGSTQGVPVKDNGGGLLLTVSVGEQWMLYLADNSTAAGVWRVFRFGASTATVNPSTLAGYGVVNTSGTLSQAHAVTSLSSSPYTVVAADRAGTLVWTGSGNATFNLTAAATLGNNFFFLLRNAGGGDVTLDPNASETIDGSATISLQPGESAILVTDGTKWFSVGLGRQAVFAFDFTSISLASAPATYTLSGAELNRVAYKFTGALTNNVQVIVPATIQQYWVDNRTTGAFSVTVKTASGTGIVVNQNTRGIYYCDGTNVVNADTAATALPINPPDGGTGITSYTTGDMLYASSSSTMAKLAAVAAGKALISAGVGVPPTWGLIDLGTMVTGGLPVANGGTGLSAALTTNALVKQGATTFTASIAFDDGSNFGIGTPTPGQKLDITGSSSPYIRLNTSSGTNKRVGIQFSAGGSAQFEQGVDLSSNNTRNWYLWDNVAATARMVVDSTGNITAGASGPLESYGRTTLSVYDSSTGGLLELGGLSSGHGVMYWSNSASAMILEGRSTNAGLIFTAVGTGSLLFLTSSVERMRVDSSGNVGIGTSSPSTRLTVRADSTATNLLSLTDANASGKSWGIGPSAGTADPTIFALYNYTDSQAASYYKTGASGYWAHYTNGSERVRIDSSGNVGIGTSSPGAALHINRASGTSDMRLTVGGTLYCNFYASASDVSIYNVTAAPLILGTSNTERVRIDASGNVGIGTPTPDKPLVVMANTAAYAIGIRGRAADNVGILQFANNANTVEYGRLTHFGTDFQLINMQAYSITFGTSNAEKMRLDASGKLGIGTTTPSNYLHVKSPDGYIRTETTSTTSKRAAIAFSQNGTQNWDMGVDLGGTNTNDFYLYDNLAGAARLTISAGGAIALRGQVYFDTTATQNIGADSTTMYLRATNFSFQNATATSTQMYLANDKLGIGTTGPSYRLDVVSGDTASGYAARLRAPATGAGQVVLQFTDNAASVEWGHIRAGSGGLVVSNATTWGVDIGGSSKLSLSSTGAVTSPDIPGAVGTKGIISSTTSGTAVIGDTGKVIKLSAGITIPASVYAADTVISLYNDTAGALTITQGAGLTMWMQGTGNTGNRTLAQHGFATIWFKSTTECVIGGVT